MTRFIKSSAIAVLLFAAFVITYSLILNSHPKEIHIYDLTVDDDLNVIDTTRRMFIWFGISRWGVIDRLVVENTSDKPVTTTVWMIFDEQYISGCYNIFFGPLHDDDLITNFQNKPSRFNDRNDHRYSVKETGDGMLRISRDITVQPGESLWFCVEYQFRPSVYDTVKIMHHPDVPVEVYTSRIAWGGYSDLTPLEDIPQWKVGENNIGIEPGTSFKDVGTTFFDPKADGLFFTIIPPG